MVDLRLQTIWLQYLRVRTMSPWKYTHRFHPPWCSWGTTSWHHPATQLRWSWAVCSCPPHWVQRCPTSPWCSPSRGASRIEKWKISWGTKHGIQMESNSHFRGIIRLLALVMWNQLQTIFFGNKHFYDTSSSMELFTLQSNTQYIIINIYI